MLAIQAQGKRVWRLLHISYWRCCQLSECPITNSLMCLVFGVSFQFVCRVASQAQTVSDRSMETAAHFILALLPAFGVPHHQLVDVPRIRGQLSVCLSCRQPSADRVGLPDVPFAVTGSRSC